MPGTCGHSGHLWVISVVILLHVMSVTLNVLCMLGHQPGVVLEGPLGVMANGTKQLTRCDAQC